MTIFRQGGRLPRDFFAAETRQAANYPAMFSSLHSRLLERAAKLSDLKGGGFADQSADH